MWMTAYPYIGILGDFAGQVKSAFTTHAARRMACRSALNTRYGCITNGSSATLPLRICPSAGMVTIVPIEVNAFFT